MEIPLMSTKSNAADTSSLLEGHVVIAADGEIDAIAGDPRAFYVTGLATGASSRDIVLPVGSSLVLRDVEAMHWLLTSELPGESGPASPAAFLQRGGVAVEAPTVFVLEDGERWSCASARCFSVGERCEILAAMRSVDRDALRRKGGDPAVAEWQKLCELLADEDQATRFMVAANVCLRVSLTELPIFNPPLTRRETQRGQHARGSLSAMMKSSGVPIGGEDSIGFGGGPARAFRVGMLETLDVTEASPAIQKCWKAARSEGKGLIAYQRLPDRALYESALYWLTLGYFDSDEVIGQLREELDAPEDAIRRAVAAVSAVVVLDQSAWPAVTDCDLLFEALEVLRGSDFLVFEYAGFVTDQGYELVETAMAEAPLDKRPFCFFHQQCILGAREGEGLRLYFGEAQRTEDGVAIDVSQEVGTWIASAIAEKGLAVEWDGSAASPLVVRLAWRCRGRRSCRAMP